MSYISLSEKLYKIQQLKSISALLNWDMEVKMPSDSDKIFRADQSAFINGMIHDYSTDKDLILLVEKLISSNNLSDIELKNTLIIKKDIDISCKFSKQFVEKESKITSEAYSIWEKAKHASDFTVFQDYLEKIVDLQLEKCEILGYENHPYNALLDLYEEGSTVKELDVLFTDVANRLKPLIENVVKKQSKTTQFLTQYFDPKIQMDLVADILNFLQIEATKYRLDLSSHPFCTHFHPTDVRITTRINEKDLMSSIWSAIHESGHASYEMGLDTTHFGMPSSEAVSLGIHESQSRFWENNIARSIEFIEAIFPLLTKHFPEQFKKASPIELFEEINYIEPTLIRTESDELTYHYHIMIRYEIEKKLIDKTLKAKDVKEYWNEQYKKYLNLDVPNDTQGCLQDVHWSFGGIGYFPTYSQGSFFAAQWYHQIAKELPNFKANIKTGDFKPIFDWHHNHIHASGRLITSNELALKATGSKLDFTFFEQYIQQKFNLY